MRDFERRLSALGLGESTFPLVDFLREFGTDAFQEFVKYRLQSFSARDLQDAALDDWALAADALAIPVELEVVARVSGTLKARLLADPDYWKGSNRRSCAEAFKDILSVVAEDVEQLQKWKNKGAEELDVETQRTLLGLFMFASNLFAGLGAESRFIRRHMGIRKGLFG